MKFKDTVVITEYSGGFALAAIGRAGESYKGIMKLNASAAFVCELLKNEITRQEIAEEIMKKFSNVSKEAALENVDKLVNKLKKEGLLE